MTAAGRLLTLKKGPLRIHVKSNRPHGKTVRTRPLALIVTKPWLLRDQGRLASQGCSQTRHKLPRSNGFKQKIVGTLGKGLSQGAVAVITR